MTTAAERAEQAWGTDRLAELASEPMVGVLLTQSERDQLMDLGIRLSHEDTAAAAFVMSVVVRWDVARLSRRDT